MDKSSVTYKARMRVSEAIADPRTSELLCEMMDRAPWLFAQAVDTAYLAAQILLEKEEKAVNGHWDDVMDIVHGALIHDIGMLSLPDAILNKTGSYTDRERAVLRSHCDAGVGMVEKLGYSGRVLKIVRGHHERMDGSGYPNARPPEYYGTKLVSVCDVYLAMTSERSYRRTFNIYEACELMANMPLSQGALMDLKRCNDI